MGVRLLTLTWNYPNELGHPNYNLYKENTTQGLTTKGREFVDRMEELGMLIDISHLSDAGFYDVVESSKKPFVASHSNARMITPCVRNLTDDMIRKIGERGGLIGLNFCMEFLLTQAELNASANIIEAVVKHAQHIINVGGIDCLGLGSDFDGIDTNTELRGAQDMERLWDIFKKIKLSKYDIEKIFYKNAIRIFRDVLK